MNTDFDFDKIGKRMPYTVPDNFFSEMGNSLLKDVSAASATTAKRRRPFMRIVCSAATVAAAAITLLLVVNHKAASTKTETVEFNDVEQAFARLNSTDQTYLLEVYQDDIFLNGQ